MKEVSIPEILIQMIERLKGNHRDVAHFLKVYAYAKTIAEKEGLPPETQKTVEIAAIVHDISCPLCREKYGSTDGKLQEKESPALVNEFLQNAGLPPETLDRIVYLVAHHHTLTNVDGIDLQILLEADYLVNADEHGDPETAVRGMLERVFKTDAGSRMLKSIYSLG